MLASYLETCEEISTHEYMVLFILNNTIGPPWPVLRTQTNRCWESYVGVFNIAQCLINLAEDSRDLLV